MATGTDLLIRVLCKSIFRRNALHPVARRRLPCAREIHRDIW